MILGDYVTQEETLQEEYKEFCFKLKLHEHYSLAHMYSIVRSGSFLYNFNLVVLKNIYMYLDVYIPRYLCSFHNTTSTTKARLTIGIDDFQEITGIPFDGDLTNYETGLQAHVHDLLDSKVTSRCCVSIQLSVKPCAVEPCLLDRTAVTKLVENKRKQDTYHDEYKRYSVRKKKWIEKIFLYKSKLQSFLNSPKMRREFMRYLSKHGVMIDLPKQVHIDHESIHAHRSNPNHYIFWLIRFKDERSAAILRQKPVPPQNPRFSRAVVKTLTRLSELRGVFAANGVSYYVIQIEFAFASHCGHKLRFLRDNCWRCAKRQYYSDGPQCVLEP